MEEQLPQAQRSTPSSLSVPHTEGHTAPKSLCCRHPLESSARGRAQTIRGQGHGQSPTRAPGPPKQQDLISRQNTRSKGEGREGHLHILETIALGSMGGG